MRDLANNVKLVNIISPVNASGASDVASSWIDRKGFESVLIGFHTGAEGDTLSGSLKMGFKIEVANEDNQSDARAVTADDVILPAQFAAIVTPSSGVVLEIDAAAETPQISGVGLKSDHRYFRVTQDKTGTHTTGTPIGVFAVLGDPHKRPVAA